MFYLVFPSGVDDIAQSSRRGFTWEVCPELGFTLDTDDVQGQPCSWNNSNMAFPGSGALLMAEKNSHAHGHMHPFLHHHRLCSQHRGTWESCVSHQPLALYLRSRPFPGSGTPAVGCCMEMDAVQTPAWVLTAPQCPVSSLGTLTPGTWKGCQPGQLQHCRLP